MSALAQRLLQRIARDGPIGIDAFMEAALLDPDFGYYRTRAAIGRRGDFITSPEISQAFGELIGAWAATVWPMLGRPDPLRLVELGPGRGTLMADALRLLARHAPDFLAALELHLVEVSPELRAMQQQRLAPFGLRACHWHEHFAAVPPGPLILIANEFFDALPLRQFQRTADGWRERRVGLAAEAPAALAFVLGPEVTPTPAWPAALAAAPVGSIVERCPEAEALAAAIAGRLVREGGAALIIDYGPAASAPGDSLQAIAGHRLQPPLDRPGEADLSHHVDFAALAAAAAGAGAAVFGAIPQGLFLSRLGIAARAERLMAAAPGRAGEIAGAIRRLVHPGRMGVLFKALAIAAPGSPPPPGFEAA